VGSDLGVRQLAVVRKRDHLRRNDAQRLQVLARDASRCRKLRSSAVDAPFETAVPTTGRLARPAEMPAKSSASSLRGAIEPRLTSSVVRDDEQQSGWYCQRRPRRPQVPVIPAVSSGGGLWCRRREGWRGASDARRREGASLAPAGRPRSLFRPPGVDHRMGDDRRQRTP
jgi:hypothetical protein